LKCTKDTEKCLNKSCRIVEFGGGYKRISLVYPWLAQPRSGQNHFEFFKWNP